MGHVVYKETQSNIIRPSSSKPSYSPNFTFMDEAKRQKLKKLNFLISKEQELKKAQLFREQKLDLIFFKAKSSYFDSECNY